MKVGVIGAGTMGQGIAKAFAQIDGYEVALCDIKQEWADGGKAKIQKGYARLVEKGKMTQEAVDAILTKITPGRIKQEFLRFYHFYKVLFSGYPPLQMEHILCSGNCCFCYPKSDLIRLRRQGLA